MGYKGGGGGFQIGSRLKLYGLITNHEQFFGVITNHRLNLEAE